MYLPLGAGLALAEEAGVPDCGVLVAVVTSLSSGFFVKAANLAAKWGMECLPLILSNS